MEAVTGDEDERTPVGPRLINSPLWKRTSGWQGELKELSKVRREAEAIDLLPIAPLVVDDACRSAHFGPVVAVPPTRAPATRLLAYLGRQEAATWPTATGSFTT
jgi:hypothetical protein